MMTMDPIPKSELDAIRQLSDEQLTKLITEISQYSWVKAQPTLRLMAEERQKARTLAELMQEMEKQQ